MDYSLLFSVPVLASGGSVTSLRYLEHCCGRRWGGGRVFPLLFFSLETFEEEDGSLDLRGDAAGGVWASTPKTPEAPVEQRGTQTHRLSSWRATRHRWMPARNARSPGSCPLPTLCLLPENSVPEGMCLNSPQLSFFFFLIVWPCLLACENLAQPEIEPKSSPLAIWCLNHWPPREVPTHLLLL